MHHSRTFTISSNTVDIQLQPRASPRRDDWGDEYYFKSILSMQRLLGIIGIVLKADNIAGDRSLVPLPRAAASD